ncbi:probable serine protease/ABC transporter B family protein tagD [Coccomyxa sp. Obi]|nr:probable serine protease/ABC transporter B family protein tagD [Coccomyxa sp. Obi]
MQTGTAAPVDLSSNQPYGGAAATHALWQAGLQGQGMVLGMGDTGLDFDQCYFYDSAVRIPYSIAQGLSQEPGTGIPYFQNSTHRKVRYYRMFADATDGEGHGTHCAGSAVGALANGAFSNWQGMAPGAKMAFQDLGSDNTGTLNVPYDLFYDYFPYNYQWGARVHSDSWGTADAVYDSLAADMDRFAWAYQDFLPVVAAGNFGYREEDSTLTSPAVAKNCVAVGAGLTASYNDGYESEVVTTDGSVYALNVTGGQPGSQTDGTVLIKVMQAAFGPTLSALVNSAQQLPLLAANPMDACTALLWPESFRNAVVLAQRGNCTFATKVSNAQKAGAVAVLMANNGTTGFFRMQPDSTTSAISIPSASFPFSTAMPLWNSLTAGMTLSAQFLPYTLPTDRFASLAFFSSIGPTLDGRIKPDIIATGTTISTSSSRQANDYTCSLDAMRGTSMATPMVAGGLLLIRQYFTEGWYPSGAPNSSCSYTPSGPLMKAVLLGKFSIPLSDRTDVGIYARNSYLGG